MNQPWRRWLDKGSMGSRGNLSQRPQVPGRGERSKSSFKIPCKPLKPSSTGSWVRAPEAFLPAAVRAPHAPQTAQSRRLLGEARGGARQPTDELRHHWAHSGRPAHDAAPDRSFVRILYRPVVGQSVKAYGCLPPQLNLRSVLTLGLYPSNTAKLF